MAIMYKSVLASGGGVEPTGNATPADVLSGKTFSNASGIDKTGTMVNNGAVSQTISAGQSYTIPIGYHNGSGVISATGIEIPTKTGFYVPEVITASTIRAIDISSGSGTFTAGTTILNVDGYSQVYFNGDSVGMYGTNDLTNFTPISASPARTYNISAYKYVVFYQGTSSQTGTFT